MHNGEHIYHPSMYCPKCHKIMEVIFHDDRDDIVDFLEGTCSNDHKTTLRVKKGTDDKVILEQMEYIVEMKGGDVIY